MNTQVSTSKASALRDRAVSKVLVLDNNSSHSAVIRKFCERNGLVPLKLRKELLLPVLRTNIELGAVLYSEDFGDTQDETVRIALQIHATRPELPIIIRRSRRATLQDLPEKAQRAICGAYVATDMDALRPVVDQYIFCLMYPNALLRGIAEITGEVLSSQFPSLTLKQDTPLIVQDRVIIGDILSLIQLESSWCRGYMMLQTDEQPFLEMIGGLRTVGSLYRETDMLSELTNRIWGSFKNRFIGDSRSTDQAQVPLVINHRSKYISFGTQNPQLCFRYTLSDPDLSCTVHQRFIFNLNWTPEHFKEVAQDEVNLLKAGEVEFF